jgi:type I restriction enzyme S subunit
MTLSLDMVSADTLKRPGANESWPTVRLEEVCQVNPGKPKSQALPADAPVTFVPMAAVDEITGAITSPEEREFAKVRGSYTAFREGDVLFAKITPCMENGKAAIARDLTNGLGFGSSEFHVLRPSDKVLPEFIYQLIRQKSFRAEAKDNMTGSVGQARVPTDWLKDYSFELPTVEEQRQIVDLVARLQVQMESTSDRLATIPTLLKKFRQSVLAAACSGQLTADWRESEGSLTPIDSFLDDLHNARRLSGAKTPKNAQAEPTPVFDIPDSWRWVSLRTLVDLKGGVTKGEKRKAGQALVSVPYLRVANVQRGFLDLKEVKYIEATYKDLEELRLQPNDILFNEGGDRDKLGRGWVWEGQIPDCIHQNHVFRGRLFDQRIPAKLVSLYGNSIGAQHFIDEGKQTVNLASLSITKLGDMAFPLAPPEEMAEIIRRVDSLFALADSSESRLAEATAQVERTTQAILAKAFRGEL